MRKFSKRWKLAGFINVVMMIAIALSFGPETDEIDAAGETRAIRDDSTGGDCAQVGVWEATSKTCTLTTDVDGKFIIDGDGVTLDGGGHRITGTGPENPADYVWGSDGGGVGVNINASDDVTVRNAVFSRFDDSIRIFYSNAITVTGVTSELHGLAGVSFDHGNDCTISGNTFFGNGIQAAAVCIGYESSGNTISDNDVQDFNLGIYSHTYTSGNILSNNRLADNTWGLTFFEKDVNAVIYDNDISGGDIGIYLHDHSDNAVIRNNTISGAGKGLFFEDINGTSVRSNRLLGNTVQAEATGAGSNHFGLPAPDGGNFWSNYATPADGCSDVNADGFCDAPFVATGVSDPAPWVKDSGWGCGRPDLGLKPPRSFWDGYGDYQQRLLSLAWTVQNQGNNTAFGSMVTGSDPTNGVILVSGTPVPVGTIAGMNSAGAALKYLVPPGVTSFRATLWISAQDHCGVPHFYPSEPSPAP